MKLNAGDRVAYSAKFLRNTGMIVGSAGKRRGTVLDSPETLGGLDPERFVAVLWNGDTEPMVILADNLAKPGPNRRFASVD